MEFCGMKREIDRKCLNHARVHANAQSFDRCEGQRSLLLVLTKRSAASGDENAWVSWTNGLELSRQQQDAHAFRSAAELGIICLVFCKFCTYNRKPGLIHSVDFQGSKCSQNVYLCLVTGRIFITCLIQHEQYYLKIFFHFLKLNGCWTIVSNKLIESNDISYSIVSACFSPWFCP